jgi:hypothetical protein
MITEQFAQEVIEHYSSELIDQAQKHPISLNRTWASRFPDAAGVYAIFFNGKVVYTGETGKISARLGDLIDTRNHTLRRNLGKGLFSEKEGYQDASAKKKFPEHIENLVNSALEQMTVAVLPISLGRSEVEEYLVGKYNPVFNSKTKRK